MRRITTLGGLIRKTAEVDWLHTCGHGPNEGLTYTVQYGLKDGTQDDFQVVDLDAANRAILKSKLAQIRYMTLDGTDGLSHRYMEGVEVGFKGLDETLEEYKARARLIIEAAKNQ
jgi:hypothetical protein